MQKNLDGKKTGEKRMSDLTLAAEKKTEKIDHFYQHCISEIFPLTH